MTREQHPILLVEDSEDDRELTILALQRENVANPIDVARDGEQALAYLEDPSRPLPELVLLDLKLPKVMGLDVLARLRENDRTRLVPVVVLTGSREESDRYSSYRNGCNAYVQKPVAFNQFTDAVKQLGLFWTVLNQPPPHNPPHTQNEG